MASCICYGSTSPQPPVGGTRIVNGMTSSTDSDTPPAVLAPITQPGQFGSTFYPSLSLNVIVLGTMDWTVPAFPAEVGGTVDVPNRNPQLVFTFSDMQYGSWVAGLAPVKDKSNGNALITSTKLPLIPKTGLSNVWFMEWSPEGNVVTVGDYPNIGWALYGQPDVYFTQLDGMSATGFAETRIDSQTLVAANYLYVMNAATGVYKQYRLGCNSYGDYFGELKWTVTAASCVGRSTDGVVTISFGGAYLNAAGQYVNMLVQIAAPPPAAA
jgi:hypothetical protein